MSESSQDVYAKYLKHVDYGYPLRMPEPMRTLPQNYQDTGLEIGDVGIVDNKGQFDVLFNICKRHDNVLHERRGVPENFQPIQVQNEDLRSSDSAISPGPILSRGIERILKADEQSISPRNYEFNVSTPGGAILILPHGAKSVELSSPGAFRELAMKNALDWYEFAKKRYGVKQMDRSLYLITGFYKARSWSLGSFNNPTNIKGKILAKKVKEDPAVYLLEFAFHADRRDSGGDNAGSNVNQTVFITGFRIAVSSWLQDPVVLEVTKSETSWDILVRLFKACISRIRGLFEHQEYPAVISIEPSPQLSQPFHPSDIINRALLSKNASASIAITHDNQWMDMMKGGLTHEDLLKEDRLESFLTRYYTTSIDLEHENPVVFLRGKADGSAHSVSHSPLELETLDQPAPKPEVPPSTPEVEIPPTTPTREVSSVPPVSEVESPPLVNPSHDSPLTVITRTCIRAENIPSTLKRLPAGFYVLIQFDGARRRTRIKSLQLDSSIIEWQDVIQLHSKLHGTVRFTVYATFELQETLGNGEELHTSECRVEEFIGGTYLMTFSPDRLKNTAPTPSLLVTLGRWYSNRLTITPSGGDYNLESEGPSVLLHETNLGQEALLRYHSDYLKGDLEEAVQHFERARQDCPPTHRYYAAALVNVAKAKFMLYQTDPTSVGLDESIGIYRLALDLRGRDHPDTPATLLHLAQTLLFQYEKEGCNESISKEINECMIDLQELPEDSHERRAARLVLQTLKRCRVVHSGNLTELNELIRELKNSLLASPDDYFDRPQRFINLGTALWTRYEKHGVGDLGQSLEVNKQALQLVPSRHPDRLPVMKHLHVLLWRHFKINKDIGHLRELIRLSKEALQIIPERHPECPYWVTNSINHGAKLSEYLGDTEFEAENYDAAIAQYSQVIARLQPLVAIPS